MAAQQEEPPWIQALGRAPPDYAVPFQQGRQMLHTGQLGHARECLEKALQVATALQEQELMALALCQLGHCHSAAGDFRNAVQCHQSSRSLSQAAGNQVLSMYSLGDIAHLQGAMGMWPETIQSLEEQLRLCRGGTGPDTVEPAVLDQLALAYRNTGNFREAERHLEELRTLARRRADRGAEGSVLERMAQNAAEGGNWGSSLRHIDGAIEVARTLGHQPKLGMLIISAMHYAARAGKFAHAHERREQYLSSIPEALRQEQADALQRVEALLGNLRAATIIGALGLAATLGERPRRRRRRASAPGPAAPAPAGPA